MYSGEVRANWNLDEQRLNLEFEEETHVGEFHEEVRQQNGFMVPLPVELKLYSTIGVALRVGGDSRLVFDAEVAQAFALPDGDWNTAFLVPKLPRLIQPQVNRASEGEMRGMAPVYRIQRMNPNEKARLAMRAGKQERQVLLRDSSPMVLQALLVNPRIEAKDILRIVKSTHANAGLLKRIAEDGRWGKNQEILAIVARNPKTPAPFATRLIDRLRTSDLRMMGKMSSGLREDLRRAALKEYMRRSRH